MEPLVAGVYLRISLDRDQQQLAIARQRADCLALCERRGWQVIEYVDNSISASGGKVRPAYRQMLADIADGKIGAVVAWDADRLHRVPRELEDFIDLADRHGLALATVGGDFDLSTPTGRGNARMKGVFSRMELEQKSVRQKRAAVQKAERGIPQWRSAFGYLPYEGRKEDDQGVRELDPVTAPLVQQVYAAVLAGSSISDAARMLNERGALSVKGAAWSPSTLSLFLRAPRNAGLRTHRDKIVGPGTWPALVDETTWRAVQAVIDSQNRTVTVDGKPYTVRLPGRKSVTKHPLTGVMGCGKCGGRLTGTWAMQRGNRAAPRAHSIVYQCKSCRGVSIRAEHLEAHLYGLVGATLAEPDARDLLRKEQHDTHEAEAARIEANTLTARLDEIAVERADGLIDGKAYKIMVDRINTQLAEVERRTADQERLRVFDGLPLGWPEVAEAIRELSADRFRAVVRVLMDPVVLPVGKGSGAFNPDRIVPNWR